MLDSEDIGSLNKLILRSFAKEYSAIEPLFRRISLVFKINLSQNQAFNVIRALQIIEWSEIPSKSSALKVWLYLLNNAFGDAFLSNKYEGIFTKKEPGSEDEQVDRISEEEAEQDEEEEEGEESEESEEKEEGDENNNLGDGSSKREATDQDLDTLTKSKSDDSRQSSKSSQSSPTKDDDNEVDSSTNLEKFNFAPKIKTSGKK